MGEDMPQPFLLLPSALSEGRPLLCADGLLLGGLDPAATLTVLSGHLCWAHVPHPLPVQSLWVLREHQEHVRHLVLPCAT